MALISPAQAQDYYAQFKELVNKQDTVAERTVLRRWHAAQPGNADLYTAYFNFYFNKGRTSILSLSPQRPIGKSIALSKKGRKKPVAYLGDGGYSYNQAYLNKAFAVIDTAIVKYPNRLDMRFGKTAVYGVLGDYNHFADEIINTIIYSAANHNQWIWSQDQIIPDGKDFLLSNVQTYTKQLFDAGDAQLDNVERVSRAVIAQYPDQVEALSDAAVVQLMHNKPDAALLLLLKAEQLRPKDYIVLNNIAYSYKLKGDNTNARRYYNLVAENAPDEEEKKKAEENIKKLNP